MPGPTLFRPSNITTGLVGYWKLDEASGSRADSSGNANTLTDNNTVTSVAQDYWKTGENSADFESGNSEYLNRASASCVGLNITGTYTFVAWVKFESDVTGYVMSKWTSNTGYAVGRVVTSGDLRILHDSTTIDSAGTVGISVGKWQHIAYVYDTAGNTISFYIDGNCIAVKAATVDPSSTSHAFALGDRGDVAQMMDGLMKDAAIWNVALTPIQIKSLALGVDLSTYAYRPNNVSTAPTHYYKLNELSSGGGAVTRVDSALSGGINLTDNNTVTTAGGYVEGAGALFTAANSEYLSGADTADIDFGTADYTIAWQMKWTVVGTARLWALGQYSSGAGIQMDYTAGSWTLYNNGNAGTTDAFSFTPVAGVWYHMLLKRSSGNVYFFVDGAQIGTSANSDNIAGGTAGFTLGVWVGTLSNYYDGIYSDFAWWKGYALTDAEIKSLACGIPLQQTGIVSYWKLDETSGTRADSIGANNLTDNNTVLSGTGKVSNAADFESTNSEYLTASDSADWDFGTDGMSILTWLKPESLGGGEYAISRSTTPDFGLLVSSGGLNFYIEGGVAASYATPITVGSYSHIALVRDGANARINLNSAQVATGANTSDIQGTVGLNIGSSAVPSAYYDGLMDELVIAKRWFRDEEIKTIYCKGLAGKELTSEERASSSGNFFLMF